MSFNFIYVVPWTRVSARKMGQDMNLDLKVPQISAQLQTLIN